jgi:hypothetical protein
MSGRIPTRPAILLVAILAALGAIAATAGTAGAELVYDNIPSPLPGNFSSLGNEAYSTSELGGEVELAGRARNDLGVKVVMSSWACERGNWVDENCESGLPRMKGYFAVPVTFRIYEAGPGNTVGALRWTRTKSFKMDYRPSGSPKCTGGRWYDEADATCYHGKAFVISLTGMRVRHLPAKVIISVSYNTTDHGPHPIGPAACDETSEGCPYNSLNVGLSEPGEHTLSLGSDPTEDMFVNSTYPEMFCEGGVEGTFGPASCPAFWEGAQPLFKVTAK